MAYGYFGNAEIKASERTQRTYCKLGAKIKMKIHNINLHLNRNWYTL